MSQSVTPFYAHQIPIPTSEYEFEEMCAVVYGARFKDPSPNRNGRRGNAQGGVDIFVSSPDGRIAIQCKRYKTGSLTLAQILNEVNAADKSGVKIIKLIVTTTAASDAKLLASVQKLSEGRTQAGLFPVKIDFWEEVEAHIRTDPELVSIYSPNEPSGVFHRVGESLREISDRQLEDRLTLSKQIADLSARLGSPGASDAELRSTKADLKRLVDTQLDLVSRAIRRARYRDAEDQLKLIEVAYASFDDQTKAIWHRSRGTCRLHLYTIQSACTDFIHAYRLFSQDELIVADTVHALRLQSDAQGAISLGQAALMSFPTSAPIWAAIGLARSALDEVISEDFFPPEVLTSVEILTLLCAVAAKNNDRLGAWEYAEKILRLDEIKPSQRTTALCAATALSAPFTRGPDEAARLLLAKKTALTHVVRVLEPREEVLWQIQSNICLPHDVQSLCFAYHQLGRFDDILALFSEAADYPEIQKELWALKLSALHFLHRDQDLVREAQSAIDHVPPPAIPIVAEAAANVGDIAMIASLIQRAQTLDGGVDVEVLRALSSLAMLRNGRRDEAIAAAQSISLDNPNNPRAMLIAIKALIAADCKETAIASLHATAEFIDAQAPLDIQAMLADCYFRSGQFSQAAERFERLYISGLFDECVPELLHSYVEAGMRVKARDLLLTMPSEWIENDQVRKAAISLASRASDWELLRRIAETQLRQRADHAGAWLLALHCERYSGTMEKFRRMIREIPERLEASISQTAQLAAQQFQYGADELALRRLYRMVRQDMQSDEAASAYIKSILTRSEIELLRQTPQTVGAGTACILVAADNRQVIVCIEPHNMDDLPKERNYFGPEHPTVAELLGKSVGDQAMLPGSADSGRLMTIKEISPLFRHCYLHLQELTESNANGLPGILTSRIVDRDGEADLSAVYDMVRNNASGESAKSAFDMYAQRSMTLGMLATILDTSTLELVTGWPIDAAPLRVSSGSASEGIKLTDLLKNGLGSVVVDLVTLGDLVVLGCEKALLAADNVYISATAIQVLNRLLENVSGPPPRARAAVIDGEVQFFAYPTDYHERLTMFYRRIEEAARRYCTICPAYGSESLPSEFVSLDGKIGEDEYEALILAVEKSATLLSLDLHLRELAEICLKLSTIWPQQLIAHATDSQKISILDYHKATQILFLNHRGLTAVRSDDLLFMLLQGDAPLQAGVHKIATEFANANTDFATSLRLIEELVERLIPHASTLTVLLELVEALYEPLWRHPTCRVDFMEYTRQYMKAFAARRRANYYRMMSEDAKRSEDAQLETIYLLMFNSVQAARLRAEKPYEARALPISVLFGPEQPVLVERFSPFVND
jgi:tetratricopeptide (TPR) repeat protein